MDGFIAVKMPDGSDKLINTSQIVMISKTKTDMFRTSIQMLNGEVFNISTSFDVVKEQLIKIKAL